jgi:hypothetical protein
MIRTAVAIAAALALAGCVRVRPHQRETLARPAMQSDPWPQLGRGSLHVYEVREGTGGGHGMAGGGCGCN